MPVPKELIKEYNQARREILADHDMPYEEQRKKLQEVFDRLKEKYNYTPAPPLNF